MYFSIVNIVTMVTILNNRLISRDDQNSPVKFLHLNEWGPKVASRASTRNQQVSKVM